MGHAELMSGFSEWSLAHEAAVRGARKLRRNSIRRRLHAAAEIVGFVILISLALPAAASLGMLLGTGLAP